MTRDTHVPIEPPGWYGKLPALGDFASRRLAPEFVEPWDDWLAQGLAAWRGAVPEGWRDEYFAGPSWRFVLPAGTLPGAAGRGAWAGVLMPSIDRVGRCFPLTLAQPIAALPTDAVDTERLLRWLQRLDDVAADAVHDNWDIGLLEAALHTTGGWPPAAPQAGDTEALLAGIDLHAHPDGHGLWLGLDGDGRTRLRVEAGLPVEADFRALLRGLPAGHSAPLIPPASSTPFRELP